MSLRRVIGDDDAAAKSDENPFAAHTRGNLLTSAIVEAQRAP
jgi:hypothetical protein